MRALGGEITVRNHPEGGAEFIFVMKVESMSATLTQEWSQTRHDSSDHR